MRLIPDAVRAGATQIVIRGVDDTPGGLRRLVEMARGERTAALIVSAALPFVPQSLRPFFVACATHARHAMSVGGVSELLSVSRRTLRADVRRACLPAPHVIIAWNRVLHLLRAIEEQDRPLEQLADRHGFASASVARHMLRRYTGYSQAGLHARGGFSYALHEFGSILEVAHGFGQDLSDPPTALQRTLTRPILFAP